MSTSKKNLPWDAALSRLQEGNERFVADKLENANNDAERRGSLTGGQFPYAIILSCADSRVVPELSFDTGIRRNFCDSCSRKCSKSVNTCKY